MFRDCAFPASWRRVPVLLASLVVALTGLPCATPVAAGELYVSHYENVLGTSLELRMIARDSVAAERAEELALAEIDRLNAIFSTYDANSEFSRWQVEANLPTRVSPELFTVLAASDTWREASSGAFHPGAQRLTALWKRSESSGTLPTEEQRAEIVQELRTVPWQLDPVTNQAHRVGRYPVSLNAIAKGYIIDRACAAMRETEGISAALVKIGGDLRAMGDLRQPIAIRNPGGAAHQSGLMQIEIGDRGVATSGDAYRGFTVGERRFSHILDPRTGWPVDQVVSATVVAPTAMDADALATAFSVLTPGDSLKLARTLDGVECLLIDRDGNRFTSAGWAQIELAQNDAAGLVVQRGRPAPQQAAKKEVAADKPPTPDWNGGFELAVKLEINNAGEGRRYRRPYVAVWIEDNDGFPVRTLALWVQGTGRGPRWIPDLKRWYKTDHVRKFNDETDLVATISEPTRKPGEYTLVWDGTDDHGELVEPGEYTVSIEAVREHGTYQVSRKKIKLDQEPVRENLESNKEIKAASLEYRKRKSDRDEK
ncbi:MAG: DUF2271 domain-containing protein [Planctomycetota bacterium]|nr:DUF2271 domain-containing protein [Planctomycetota bacterium]